MTMGYWGAAFGFSTALRHDINSIFLYIRLILIDT